MLELLKTTLSEHTNLEHTQGIFLSAFDNNQQLLDSHGVISTNKTLNTVLDMLYHGIIEPKHDQVHTIICDLVLDHTLLESMEAINAVNLTEQGLCMSNLDASKSGILLPNTKGVQTMSQALQLLKTKHHIEGNITLYSFTTKKISITRP